MKDTMVRSACNRDFCIITDSVYFRRGSYGALGIWGVDIRAKN
jgi:hypothetical protein